MAFSKGQGTELALADRYGLMRRAYQTGDAELLRQFYGKDVVLATEGSSPIVGIDAAVSAGHVVLAKRRDITTDVLRIIHSPAQVMRRPTLLSSAHIHVIGRIPTHRNSLRYCGSASL